MADSGEGQWRKDAREVFASRFELPRVFRTCEFAVILRGCLHFPALVHGLLRGPVPERGMETLPIIAELNVPCDVFLCLLPRGVDGTVHSLDFQRTIEALGQRIVIAYPGVLPTDCLIPRDSSSEANSADV